MPKKIVKCDSGEFGVQQNLQEIYDNYQDFLIFDSLFNITKRLGYKDSKSLWNDNPLVQGSTNPKDFKIVKNGRSRV